MKTQKMWLTGAGMCVVALLGAGCQDKNNNGVPDTPATSTQIEKTVENAGQSVEKMANKAEPVLENAAKTGARMLSNAAATGKVKAALIADKTIAASEIDVTTKNNAVYLQGTVKSAAQKHLAGQIAKNEAGTGYAIKNELKIAGGAKH